MRKGVSIPQTDPKANYLKHKEEIDDAVSRVLNSGRYILGEEVSNFEREFASYIGARHGVGVGSGTEALHIALRACGVGRGDLVVTTAHTAVATVAAIELCGAMPVLVDVDPTTLTIDPNCLEHAIRDLSNAQQTGANGRPKAVIAVHLYGHPADMAGVLSLADRYGLHVIEDCAQSHGAVYRGRRTGVWGHVGAFSFYPTKNLGGLGDGGMVVTDDAKLAERARLLREYGWRERYVSELSGMNSRLDEFQAAILRAKLPHLDEENEKRRQLAAVYDGLLKGTTLELPASCPLAIPVYHQYVVRHARRDNLRTYLRECGIRTLVHYPIPIHLQPAYRDRVRCFGSLQGCEKAAAAVLSLPMYPELSFEQANVVAEAVFGWDRMFFE